MSEKPFIALGGIKNNNLKKDKILEIGCADGNKLNQYSKLLKSKKNYGIDLSKKAMQQW